MMHLDFSTLSQTLPMMLVGMAGIFLVIGVLIFCVYALNRVFSKRK